MELTVTSPCFVQGGPIPIEHTGYGADLSPELRLEGLRGDATSIAVVMDDMGHPIPAFNHWVIWNLPPSPVIPGGIAHGQRPDTPAGAVQGRGYGKHRYRGPKPPFNWTHDYRYNVYVLDCLLDLPASSRKRQVLRAMQGHILQQGAITGHYR